MIEVYTKAITCVFLAQIVNNQLQYRYNLGGGTNILILRGANVSDYKWHNVTVNRIGNFATLTMHGVGHVSGTVGSHMLLDSNGIIYAGGVPSRFNTKPPYDMQGGYQTHLWYFLCLFRVHLVELAVCFPIHSKGVIANEAFFVQFLSTVDYVVARDMVPLPH